jgi:hypothetical protein
MAAAKRAPLVRQTYYFGSKKVQVGNLKGGVRVGFIALPARTAAALNIKLNLPKNIPGTTYSIEDGIIYDSHSSGKGKKVKTPVQGRVGSKKISVKFESSKVGGVGVHKLSGLKGSKKPTIAGDTASVEIGVPAWADVATTRLFLKGTKAISFSFGGGEPYQINVKEAK